MLRRLLCAVLLAAAAAGSDCDAPARPLVATREGLVRGTAERSAAGRDLFAFRGIPYGTAARFEPPRRRAVWPGVREAAAHGAVCPQFNFLNNMTATGEEDCLFANVYTPRLPGPRDGGLGRLPVMVWIHGGGFYMGSGDDSSYGPAYLLDENVVLVTFNYRLGVLGFFSTESSDAPGNYGLLDQVLLLQWVRDNIAAFGGDPAAVTIFGESAGGSSVSLLVLSPLAKGLFHHAISQSGSSMALFAAGRLLPPTAGQFGKLLNCSGSAAALISCVKEKSSLDILEAIRPYVMEMSFFLPRLDQEAAAPFLPDTPLSLLERGEFNLVPWINGVNEEEGALFLSMPAPDEETLAWLAAGNLTQWVKSAKLQSPLWENMLDCGADPEQEAAKVRDFYTRDGPVSAENLVPLSRALGDRMFVAPHVAEVRLASRHAPVYQYLLDHRGPGQLSIGDLFGLSVPIAAPTHADDLMYLFSATQLPLAAPGSPEYAMIRLMTDLWASFARTGRPGWRRLSLPDWPVLTEASHPYMRLNAAPSLGERLFEERAEFWQGVRVSEAWRRPEPGVHSRLSDAQSCRRPDRG